MSGFDHAETNRLLYGYRDAEAKRRKASEAAVKAQTEADDAAHEVGRYDKALQEHFEMLKATMRVEARGSDA